MADIIFPTVATKNQKITTLSASLTAIASTVDVTSATNLGIASISGSNYHYITLIATTNWRRNPLTQPETFEIVKVTAVSIGGGTGGTDRLTITRAQDGTTGTAFASGDYAEARMTAIHLSAIQNALTDGSTGNLAIASIGAVTPGTGAFTTLSASSLTLTTPLAMAQGGTGKALTAVNGGLIYSDADSMEVLAAGTNNQLLTSGGAGAPVWESNLTFNGSTLAVTGAVTVSTTLTVTGEVIGLGNVKASSTAPQFVWVETDAGADLGVWAFQATAGTLKGYITEDTPATTPAWITVSRTTGPTAITSIVFGGTSMTVPGTLAVTGAITQNADTNVNNIFGRVRIDNRVSDIAYFSHYDHTSGSAFGVAQTSAGATYVNSVTGQSTFFTINGSTIATLSSTTLTMTGALVVNGNTTLGDASTDTITCTGRMLHRSVTDAGPMTATPGTQREVVYNTSDSKFYGCTVTHGTAATWVALN